VALGLNFQYTQAGAVAGVTKPKAVILAEWQRGKKLVLFKLNGTNWHAVSPDEIFG